MQTVDIIPDIHGQVEKLRMALSALGWRRAPAGWVHSEPERFIVFLGDFIDRGPENRAVINIVRGLVDSGKARAIMGNHELNALHFHMSNPETGLPLRAHSEKNTRQHAAFLAEFAPGAAETREILAWMKTLPLYLETERFRAVHACWTGSTLDRLRLLSPDGVLSEQQLIRASNPVDELFQITEEITKGPEYRLPAGFFFRDKDGNLREQIRLRWWKSDARTWRDIAISVPVLSDIPRASLPINLINKTYPAHDRPVFFGHYWLNGNPVLQGPNALCLDYSAGMDGPLVTYELQPSETTLSMEHIRVHR